MADTEAKTDDQTINPKSNAVTSFGNKPIKAAPATEQSTGTKDEKADESKLPARLRGKTDEERVAAFSALESELGRKNNEIGQLRYSIDTMLRLREEPAATKKGKEVEPVTTDKLLNDTDATLTSVAKRVSKDELGPVEEKLALIQYQMEKDRFEKRFPGYEATMGDEAFITWVGASPLRKSLAQQALQGSFAAAHELFGIHEEISSARQSTTDTKAKTDPSEGSTLKPGAAGAKTAVVRKRVENAGKDILKRGELMMLQIKNPAEYAKRLPEIKLAYREGRVK